MNYNKVIIAGRISSDIEQRVTTTGLTVLNLSVAYNQRRKDKETIAHFFRVVFFGKVAEIVSKYMVKGQVILVEGRLSTSSWEKDGEKRYSTEIIADTMQMGARPKGSENPTPETSVQDVPIVSTQKVSNSDDIKIEDIPF